MSNSNVPMMPLSRVILLVMVAAILFPLFSHLSKEIAKRANIPVAEPPVWVSVSAKLGQVQGNVIIDGVAYQGVFFDRGYMSVPKSADLALEKGDEVELACRLAVPSVK